MAHWVCGKDLSPAQQAEAKARYIHRFTGDHRPRWVGPTSPLQFKDDADWLANSEFAMTQGGEVDKRIKYCLSNPTWPPQSIAK